MEYYKNKLKEIMNSDYTPFADIEIFAKYFPELKESENERIRKAIIMFFESEDDNTTYALVPKKDILAWLEKQGEQKSINKVEPKFNVGDTMRTLQEANDGYTDGMPVVVSIDNEYYHCTNELIAIKDQDNYEFPPINVKQKPVDKIEQPSVKWSEEDEENFQHCLLATKCSGLHTVDTTTKMYNWLQSLKKRMEEQQ